MASGEKLNGNGWNKWWPRAHQAAIFIIAVLGLIYAVVIEDSSHPALVYLFGTTIGGALIVPPLKSKTE